MGDSTGKYQWVELFFVCLCAVGVFVSWLLILEDRKTGNRLNIAHYKPTETPDAPISSAVTDYQQLDDDR